MKDPRKTTHIVNGQNVAFDSLSKELQDHLLLAYDFYTKKDNARSHEERDRLLATHPFNQ